MFALHDTQFDVAAGKPVTTTRAVVIVAADFFEASRIAEFWARRLEAEESIVEPRDLRLANIEDVYWPFHTRKREWASLAKHRMQLFNCTFAKLVPMVRKANEFKEELHNVLVAARTLDEASRVMNHVMANISAPTAAKNVKRTRVEAVLTDHDGAVERATLADLGGASDTDGDDDDEGYSKRFGLIYVDFKTQKRVPKNSWFEFKKYLKNN